MLEIGREQVKRLRAVSLPYVRNAEDLRARRVAQDTVVHRRGGDLWARKGDWIVTDVAGRKVAGQRDRWPVPAAAFAGSYRLHGDADPNAEHRCDAMGWTSMCLMADEFEVELDEELHASGPPRGQAGDYLALGLDHTWVVPADLVEERYTRFEDPAPGKLKFFLSYSRNDSGAVGPYIADLKARLERDPRGAVAFLDTEEIVAGDAWAQTTAGHIAWSDFFVTIVGTEWLREPGGIARRFELPLALLARAEHGCKIAAIHHERHVGDGELMRAATSLSGGEFQLKANQNQILAVDLGDDDVRWKQAEVNAKVLIDSWKVPSERIQVARNRTAARATALERLQGRVSADLVSPAAGPLAPPSAATVTPSAVAAPAVSRPTIPTPRSTVGRGQGCWRLWPRAGEPPDLVGVIGRAITVLDTDVRILEPDGGIPSALVGSDDRSALLVQNEAGLICLEARGSISAARRSPTVRPIPELDAVSVLAMRRDGRAMSVLYTDEGQTWECRLDGQGRTYGRSFQLDGEARIAAARATSFVAYGDGPRPVLGYLEAALLDGEVSPIAIASCVDPVSSDRRCTAVLTELDGQRVVVTLADGDVHRFPVEDDADTLDLVSSAGEVFVGVGTPATVSVWSLAEVTRTVIA